MNFDQFAEDEEKRVKREQELIIAMKLSRYNIDCKKEELSKLEVERAELFTTMRAASFTLAELAELSGVSVPTIHKLTTPSRFS